MKKLLLLLTFIIGLVSCENFDQTFSDFKYTTGYFPYQYPVRTLVLGDYIYDNSNDNAHKFIISAAIGGVYENQKNRVFSFTVDENLCNNVVFSASDEPIKALPSSYYTLSSPNQIIIPAGKFNGGVEVQLTDAFFSDPEAIKTTYVVPLVLTESDDVDTILTGRSAIDIPDRRIDAHWNVLPKDFTMFAVKYINEYHGNYFHYGSSTVKDAANTILEDSTYAAKYVEQNPVSMLITEGRYQVSFSKDLYTSVTGLKGLKADLVLNFTGNNCTITAATGSTLTISGTGVFKPKAYEWGAKKRDGIELTYTVSDGVNTYTATDVLVARDRAVIMEVYTLKVQ